MASIELIAATARNGVIGGGNRLLWRIPEDFAFFKKTTYGSPVLMGRKTWESIGRALPGRLNIVITRRRLSVPKGVLVVRSLSEAIEAAGGAERLFVTGGGEIYRQAMPLADKIWLTSIDQDFEGDTWFPTIPRAKFRKSVLKILFPTARRPWRVEFEEWSRRPL